MRDVARLEEPDPTGSDHCPAMKGIETLSVETRTPQARDRSDHCPAMKGIETRSRAKDSIWFWSRSDHCPAMKGIETLGHPLLKLGRGLLEATTAPQ